MRVLAFRKRLYKLIKKGVSTTKVLFLVIALSILGAVVGIF